MTYELPTAVNDFINYLKANDKSDVTIISYRQELNDLFLFLKEYKKFNKSTIDDAFIKSITIMDLNAFIAHLSDKVTARGKVYSPASKSKYVACIKSFFSFLINQCMYKMDNPALHLKSPKAAKLLPKYLTPEQVQRLFSVIPQGRNYERDLAMIKLYVNCGLRLSEVINLELTDIKKDIIIVNGKGDKQRLLSLNDECITVIKQWLSVRPKTDCKNLFVKYYKNKYDKMTSAGTAKMVMKYAKIARLPKWFHTHILRHSFATEALAQGNDIVAISEALGHSNIATTTIYTHVNNISKKKLAKSVAF